MSGEFAWLERIENDHEITRDTDGRFLHRLQSGLLLALKEQGRLSQAQYRYAQEQLDRRYRERARNLLEKGEST
ncbi:MAG TPA: hypothetical protein H9844_02245 [Candidatus Evtepia faecigallinarum]|nr:hypothetical protein [Candidatus Evtepia faecigallinarum]